MTTETKTRDTLTASRMAALLGCPRKHYYRYEIGLIRESSALALRFGSAFHDGMEGRWLGFSFHECLDRVLAKAERFDPLDAAILSCLLHGYYERYSGDGECIAHIYPEREFRYALKGSRTFDVCGKIDGLGQLKDGRMCLLEHKTAGEDISDGSDFWMRLRFNPQIYQYVSAVQDEGDNPEVIVYDVTRKPTIRPRESVPTLDGDGLKQVIGADGNRVYKKDGAPKQTPDGAKGEIVLSAPETVDQFSDRLRADIAERPDYYYQRREVAVLGNDLTQFEAQRINVGRMILFFRASAAKQALPEWGWPRNCNGLTCRMCDYECFCMQNVHVTADQPPAGFMAGAVNPELLNG